MKYRMKLVSATKFKSLDSNGSLYRIHKAYTQSAKVDLDFWPCDPKSIGFLLSFIIHNLHVKFESDWTKTLVCILPTNSYTQSAEVDLDIWNCDPKSIGFLFSSSKTYMWSLKVIGLKLWSVSCSQGSIVESAKVDLNLWPCDPKSIGFLI